MSENLNIISWVNHKSTFERPQPESWQDKYEVKYRLNPVLNEEIASPTTDCDGAAFR
jgi:hypothetical protein